MRSLKFDIILWDGSNKETITHYSIEEAVREDFVQFKGDAIIPTDDSVIIRQSSGLTDKNGTTIFEGDILKGYKCQFPVKFESGAFMWADEFLGYEVTGDYDASVNIEPSNPSTLEIIGNIYEN